MTLLLFFPMTFYTSNAGRALLKAIRPNQNSNLVTAVEGTLTAWVRAVTIN